MSVLGVIPARYASTRFPGKPLVMIQGKSMIQRVYEQASKSVSIDKVIVATDDSRIEEHVHSFGGHVVMTSPDHHSGTDRIGEVIKNLSSDRDSAPYEIIINIQGDEPLLNPVQLDALISSFDRPEVEIATLIKAIDAPEELFNPNVVKVIRDLRGYALYFSRSVIPFCRNTEQSHWLESSTYFKHIGIYAFRTSILERLLELPQADLEISESLEQLRWISNGYRIKLVQTDFENIAIDTPEDLLKLTNKI